MPEQTYRPLATVTLGSSASSVTFSSIPATYRDLIVVANFTQTDTTTAAIRFNSDTGSNYSYVSMTGSGAGALSSQGSGQDLIFIPFFTTSASSQAFSFSQVMDYSATDKHKTVLTRDLTTRTTDSLLATVSQANRWANTAAITTLQVFMRAGNFNAGGRFDLYGIAS